MMTPTRSVIDQVTVRLNYGIQYLVVKKGWKIAFHSVLNPLYQGLVIFHTFHNLFMDECPHYRSISLRGFEKFKSGLICCLYIRYSKAGRVASYGRCGYRISHTMVLKLLRLNRTRAGRQEAGGQSRAWRKLESLAGEHKRPQQHWPDVIVDRRSVRSTSVKDVCCLVSVLLFCRAFLTTEMWTKYPFH